MSVDWERSVHPDLREEEAAVQEQAEQAPPEQPARRGRGRTSTPRSTAPAAEPSETTAGVDPSAAVSEPAEGGEVVITQPSPSEASPPDWLATIKQSSDPQEMLATLLKNVPLDELNKHPQISGWIGNMAQRKQRELALQQQIEEAERAKSDAYTRGDYYRLGELTAPEQEARLLQAQASQAQQPFMDSVAEFQRTLPEVVQQQIQNRQYTSVAAYMQAAVDAARDYEVKQAVEREMHKRAPALQKAELSATVGSEQTPERDGGPSPGVREITDAEIGSMSLQEYENYFDEHGKPKNGVRVRYTRAVDVTRR